MAGTALTDKQRLDRVEAAVAEIAAGMRTGNGWRPELARPPAEAVKALVAERGGMERRPDTTHERRAA